MTNPMSARPKPFSMSRAHGRRHATGVSLVELMVSAAVGLLLVAGILQLFLSSRMSYTSNEAVRRVQENGRYAIHLLTQEARGARSLGCRSARLEEAEETLNVLACDLLEDPAQCAPGGASVVDTNAPIGFDAVAFAAGGSWLDPLPGDATVGAEASVRRYWLRGDILVTWGTVGDGIFIDLGADPTDVLSNPLQNDLTGSANLTATSTDLKGGRLALISDCEGSDLFTITSPTKGPAGQDLPPPSRLEHETKFKGIQVNSSTALSRFYNRIGNGYVPGARIRARVFPFEYKVFFVCCSDTSGITIVPRVSGESKCDDPALAERYRPALCVWDRGWDQPTQQMVPEIADMRVTYDGILDPNDPAATGSETRFSELAGTVPTAQWVTSKGNWPNVHSAFVELLVTSPEAVKSVAAAPNPAAQGAEDLGYGLANDRRHYQVFNTAVALRARAPWAVPP